MVCSNWYFLSSLELTSCHLSLWQFNVQWIPGHNNNILVPFTSRSWVEHRAWISMLFSAHLMLPNASQWIRNISSYLAVMDCYAHVAYWLFSNNTSSPSNNKALTVLGFCFCFCFCKKQNVIHHVFSLCYWSWVVNHQRSLLNMFAMKQMRWSHISNQDPELEGLPQPLILSDKHCLPLLPSLGSSQVLFPISLRTLTASRFSQPHWGPVVRIRLTLGCHFNCKARKFLGYIWSFPFNIKGAVPSFPMLLFSFVNSWVLVMFILQFLLFYNT